ncbi:arsenate reductase (glutaredoxin) [Orrella sp. 11846]|uniref:arsenate reductase (glutaredoxin) n=1 Tax=Orrella sp. 11846 TaxID=3409913 RepID=UPI003B59E2E3
MSDVVIYHNPQCSTSRKTLDLIREQGFEPEVVQYLKTPPNRETLVALIQKMNVPVREVLRERCDPYVELGLADPKWTDDELIDFMVEHPVLINRPIVITDLGARLCRPIESVLELLPKSK